MKVRFFAVLFLCAFCLNFAWQAQAAEPDAAPAQGEQQEPGIFDGLNPQLGPATARLGRQGTIQVPEGYAFFNAKDSRTLLERMENLTDGSELGMVCPEDFSWFIVFEFDDAGYVSDSGDDADIDADELMKSFRESAKAANKEKAARGWSATDVVGWSVTPHYNRETKNLEWGVTYRSEGQEFENYNVRLLGREGVMEVVLAGDNDIYAQAKQDARKLLEGFSFSDGKTYAEYRQGDKLAGYGLAALIGGGALAVAAKSGFLGKFIKPILAGLAAVGAFIVGLFRRKKKNDAGLPSRSDVDPIQRNRRND